LLSLVSTLKLKGYIYTLEANLVEEVDQDSKKDSQWLSKIILTNNEYLLRDLIPILEPFEKTTKYLEGNNYSTHSIIKPLIAEIINNLKPEYESNTTNINIKKIEDIF
ncbi:11660_t:CDS:1, partial [Funneliformis geosporum]